jgi:hypothetical protein
MRGLPCRLDRSPPADFMRKDYGDSQPAISRADQFLRVT